MKYAFIHRHRRVWPISVQCRVLQASVAGYHEHFVRQASPAQRRHLSDDALLVHIKVNAPNVGTGVFDLDDRNTVLSAGAPVLGFHL